MTTTYIQIKRENKCNRIKEERKREVFLQKTTIMLVATLWIMCLCVMAKPTSVQGTYIVGGHIERTTNKGYVVNVNEEIETYETDRFFPIGKMISVEMDTNGTEERSDDFITYIY